MVLLRDVLWAWLAATIFSGLPSTVYALVTGDDPLEATRAAGAMLIPAGSPLPQLLAAAALTLPRRRTLLWAIAAAALIALLDLGVIAPRLFPEVARLAFWPQFADHLVWGACVGATLAWRWRKRYCWKPTFRS
jgi:hypothetical protein